MTISRYGAQLEAFSIFAADVQPGHTTALFGHSLTGRCCRDRKKDGASSLAHTVPLPFDATSPGQAGLRTTTPFVMTTI